MTYQALIHYLSTHLPPNKCKWRLILAPWPSKTRSTRYTWNCAEDTTNTSIFVRCTCPVRGKGFERGGGVRCLGVFTLHVFSKICYCIAFYNVPNPVQSPGHNKQPLTNGSEGRSWVHKHQFLWNERNRHRQGNWFDKRHNQPAQKRSRFSFNCCFLLFLLYLGSSVC